MLLIISWCTGIFESRCFGSLLVCWSIRICVNIMPRGIDISNCFRELIVNAYHSRKGYKAISKQFRVQCSTVRRFIHKWKTFKTARGPQVRPCNTPRNTGKPTELHQNLAMKTIQSKPFIKH